MTTRTEKQIAEWVQEVEWDGSVYGTARWIRAINVRVMELIPEPDTEEVWSLLWSSDPQRVKDRLAQHVATALRSWLETDGRWCVEEALRSQDEERADDERAEAEYQDMKRRSA